MNRRILPLSFLTLALAILSACNGIDKLPGTSSTGTGLLVQIVQPPPTPTVAGQPVGLVANVLNDSKNGGVSWSCAPAGACGSFSPASTGYEVTTLYTPPAAPLNAPVTANLAYPVTVTATSATDNSQTASVTFNVAQQYAFVLAGQGSLGMVGSVTLDGAGNIVGGEADASGNGFYSTVPSISGTYSLDSTGHGTLAMTLNKTSCCGTFQQTHGITATSSSHLVIAEEDQFNGLTVGGVGSMDLQSGPFSVSEVSGGYSFTLAGYSHADSANASWGGIFTADGVGNLTGGIFDENFGGGSGYSSTQFTGTFAAPDTNGRGTLTLSATTDSPSSSTQYAYYIAGPEVLRITSVTNTGNAGNTGSAYGQGAVATTTAALSGTYIFTDYGFTSDANGGESGAAAGQFKAGAGSISDGYMDVNAFGAVTSGSFSGSYAISGSPRGTVTASSGQTYNIYLTDPNLNLLDPNNPNGGGGALLLETDAADTIGFVIPQTDPTAALAGAYSILLSDQDNPPSSDGAFTGDFTISTSTPGTFSGEGDFQGTGSSNATLVTGSLAGTFTPDGVNPGRLTGTITTTPCYPNYVPDPTSPTPCGTAFNGGTENPEQVSWYVANGSQAFVVEIDSIAPVWGLIEAQPGLETTAQQRKRALARSRSSDLPSRPANHTTQHSEISGRSR
jgi:hypothetical protein